MRYYFSAGSLHELIKAAQSKNIELKTIDLLYSYAHKDDFDNRIHLFRDVILDSGLFTYLTSKKNVAINWRQYALDYSQYVIDMRIKKYVELDADDLIGYQNVKYLRNVIESKTGIQSIPVWHINRGIREWVQMCRDYQFAAIGIKGAELKMKTSSDEKVAIVNRMIEIAHRNNCKVHGLGYSPTDEKITQMNFDTIDSTTFKQTRFPWKTRIKNGILYREDNMHYIDHEKSTENSFYAFYQAARRLETWS